MGYFGVTIWQQLFGASDPEQEDSFFSLVFRTTLFAGVGYWTFCGIDTALRAGLEYAYYQDIFIINVAVQVLTTLMPQYSWYLWWLYLAIPVFMAYKVYEMVGPFLKAMMSGGGMPGPAGEPMKSKSQMKRESRGQKYQFMNG